MGVMLRSRHDPLDFLLSTPGVTRRDGLVGTPVEEGGNLHWFDPAFHVFLGVATAFSGSVYLDSNQSGKAEGTGRFYLKLKYGSSGKFTVDRLVADAQPGERVREAADHHRHVREELTKVSGTLEEARPSKFNLGREEAIQAALDQYDDWRIENVMLIGRSEYKHMLRLLLLIADAQSARRVTAKGS